ncbi:CDP-glycerol glycerophosphotransferase family protein [Curtobacterium sp. Curtsp57]|uniref:CDP-glycerol glycerophosphotransferase family protein n=1 Tax=Curtobacterium sp. Curtsp57 TaxID=3243047 RepID=UPI0039B49C88
MRISARILRAVRSEWYAFWRRRPVRSDVVVFESFGGSGATCNPEAIFRAVHRADDLHALTSVWALRRSAAAVVRAEFRGDPRVRVVTVGGFAYWRHLATAGTLVNNSTFPPAFDRRPTYLNIWHGTPLKRMGYDEPDGAQASANVVRNFLQSTWLLSQNRYMTDVMYRGAYRLEGLGRAEVLELGYPRDDRLFTAMPERVVITNRLRGAGVRGDEQIVVYAPTWRGERFASPEDHSTEIAATAMAIQDALITSGSSARVVVQPHQAVRAFAEANPALDGRLVPADIPVNSVLAVTTVLVTDWSSIAVDFLLTRRPVVFAALDGGAYERERGAYLPATALPGRQCADDAALAAEVVRAVRYGVHPADVARYERMASDLVSSDDGVASERVLDVVFRGAPGRGVTFGRPRSSVLLHVGGMRRNGITSAALDLLPASVEAGIDVTVLSPRSGSAGARALRARVDPRVRYVQRIGGMNGSKTALLRQRRADRSGTVRAHRDNPSLAALWTDEWHRVLGDACFDAVVDFSGYSPFWATLLLHAPGHPVRSIWIHNDMAAETERLVGGRPAMRRSLRTVIGLYGQFDRVVAGSPALSEHNARSLPGLTHVRFRAARNVVDDARVLRGAAARPEDALREGRDPSSPWSRPPWLDEFDQTSTCWFVSAGRLSPEKNHARLLDAFAAVSADDPSIRLLVVGDGWLRTDLERRAAVLRISDRVAFAGAVRNPFPFLARADCVVVSSDHEGQPMVILEAAVLGRPIVSTRFDSAVDALPDEGLHLVDRSTEGVANGMRAFLAGAVPPARLDVPAYTAAATAEFLHAAMPDEFLEASGSAPTSIDP